MIPLEVQQTLRAALAERLTGRVKVDLFTQHESALLRLDREPCVSCEETEELVGDLARLSPLITLTVHEAGRERELEQRLGVERLPATVLRGVLNRAVTFYGLPLPPIFSAVLNTVVFLSDNKPQLPAEVERRLRRLKEQITIRVFVTHDSDYCRQLVETVFSFAIFSKQIRADAIEIGSFPALAERLRLTHVPFTVINDNVAWSGLVTAETLAEQIFRAVVHRAVTPERPEVIGVTALQPEQPTATPEGTVRPSGLIIPGR
jgi:glutaredoxin-like protein